LELVQAEVRTSESQILATLNQEASLLTDILLLRLQQEALATGGHPSTAPFQTGSTSKHSDAAATAKLQTSKTKVGGKESGKSE